ncbi:MAG: DNA polymerase III, subunit gamma and tau [Deltaproteobacteria bacterium RIFOXYD12_FULL_57_12]|nr:MAG: DNA polymerase III, subunit gamma and tau [Deltaproteobacteria bacterium RIFOXYD12_FULL_57_12]
MSYLVLARKWRPQTFEEVVGQQPVVRTLQNAIERGRVPHAILFSGVRGVGKTTLARIMAKAMNCRTGPTRIPCNQCDACLEITAGSAIDLHEIDGASNRGIQEIRELKENLRFFPTRDRHKIFIIDEVHMLTTEAFNALLKTLEEPPAHVLFMFATTELHKIPITILSRCQRYELKRVAFAELAGFFRRIIMAEGVVIAEPALDLIVREAGGSVRDGLSLLDQLFSYGGQEVSEDDVRQVLGLVDSQIIGSMAEALLAGDLAGSLQLLDTVCSFGIDLKRLANDLLARFRALLVCKVSNQPEKLLEMADQELAGLREIAAAHGVETLFQYFQMLLKGIDEMQYSTQPRLMLEMVFMRAAQAGSVVPMAAILEKLDSLLAGDGGVPALAATASDPATPRAALGAAVVVAKQSAPGETSAPAVSQDALLSESRAEKVAPTPPVETPPPAVQTTESRPVDTDKPVSQKEVRRHWDEFIDYVMARRKWMGLVLRLAAGIREQENEVVVKFDDLSECKRLQDPEHMKALTEFFLDFFQKERRLTIMVQGRETAGHAPGQENQTPREERRALANEPLVQTATEVFGGQVVNIRTGPRSR